MLSDGETAITHRFRRFIIIKAVFNQMGIKQNCYSFPINLGSICTDRKRKQTNHWQITTSCRQGMNHYVCRYGGTVEGKGLAAGLGLEGP